MKIQIFTRALVILVFCCLNHLVNAQSVGIGTESPNPNAVLELVSPGNNQGLLIPKMSTSQRTANSFISQLGNAENGLMVYDSDENAFYYWLNGAWQSIASNVVLTAGDGISVSGSQITNTGDLDATNEIQDISLSGTELTLSSGSTIDLATIDTDTKLTDEEIAAFGYIKLSDLTLSDDQTLSLSGTILSIDAGNSVDLAVLDTDTKLSDVEIAAMGYVKSADDADADASNEIQDLTFNAGVITLSNDPDATAIDLSGYDADASDDFDGDFTSLTNVPAGLADGDDDTQLTETEVDAFVANNGFLTVETDPSVPANIKDGIDWTEVSSIPADIADGDDDTQLTESEVDAFVSNNGYITSADDADADASNEIQDLSFSAGVITLSGDPDATSIDLSGYDTDASDDFDGDFTSLTNVPAGLADGDDDTQLTETEVDAFVSNNGFLITETDPSVPANIKDGIDWTEVSSIPADIADGDDNTQLTESEVDAFVANNGYITSADDADADASNEIQDLSFSAGVITLSGDPDATSIDLSGYDTDASDDFDGDFSSLTNIPADLADGDDDTQLTEAEVDAFVANNGFITSADDADADATNEIQDLSLNENTLSLSDDATSVDLSVYLDNTDNQTATQVPVTPRGNLASSDVQAALEELQSEITEAASAAIADGSVTNAKLSNGAVTDAKVTDVSFSKLTSVPAGLADGDDDTQLTEAQVVAFVTDNGFITSPNDADADASNEIQDLTFTDGVIALSNDPGATTIDLSGYDANASDDFNGDFASLTNVPADLADGDNDTQLTEAQVITFVTDNGFITSPNDADADASNEIQDLTFTDGVIALSNDPGATTIDLSGYDTDASDDFDGDFANLTNVPAGLADGDDDTQLTEAEVVTFVTNNGFITSADDADADATNEIQDLSFSAGVITLSGDPDATSIDLSGYDTDASDDFDGDFTSLTNVPADLADGDDDTQLTEAEVVTFVTNNGFITSADDADADATNEIQDLSLSGTTLSLSNDATSVDLSAFMDDTDDQNASEVAVSPTGNLTSNTVQQALEELQSEITDAASAAIPDGAVTTPKLSNGAVTDAKVTDVSFSKLTSVPAGLADGDDDTQLTEDEVDAFVANNGYLSTELDPTVPASIKDGIDWTELSSIPSDIADGDADTQLTEDEVDAFVANNGYISTELDPTVPASIKDGIDWTEVSSIPADIADGDADTQLTEDEVDAFVANNGYLSTESDPSVPASIKDGIDWTEVSSIPSDIADGDADTQLTEDEVDAFVANNGYLSTESDPSVPASIKDGIDWTEVSSIPSDIADGDADTQLTEDEVDAFVANNGYLSTESDPSVPASIKDGIDWTEVSSIPSDIADGDADTQLTEDEVDAFVANNGYLSTELDPTVPASIKDGIDWTEVSSIPTDIADGDADTQLTEDEVDAFVANNGYLSTELDPTVPASIKDGIDWTEVSSIPSDIADGDADTQLTKDEIAAFGFITSPNDADASATNEIQNLTFTEGVIELTGDPDATKIDLSMYDTDVTDDFDGNFASLTNVPAGLADGDDNTQLTQDEIAAFGFITSPNDADSDASNELLTTAEMSGDILRLFEDKNNVNVDLSQFREVPDVTGQAGNFLTTDGKGLSWGAVPTGVWSTNGENAYYTAGNVGIGTTNPGTKLGVMSTTSSSTSPMASFLDQTGTSDVSMNFSSQAAGNFSIGLDATDDYFKIAPGSALGANQGFRMYASGAVGFGSITSPLTTYQVEIENTTTGSVYIDNNATSGTYNYGLVVNMNTSSTAVKRGLYVSGADQNYLTGDLQIGGTIITPIANAVQNISSTNFTLTVPEKTRIIKVQNSMSSTSEAEVARITGISPGVDGQELIIINVDPDGGFRGRVYYVTSLESNSNKIYVDPTNGNILQLYGNSIMKLVYVEDLAAWMQVSLSDNLKGAIF
ncbi:beta strand repeat-containing protein [Reichenbachiella ulvae]|uniref:Por secretion system C-terminal sorting domain-containing protein n=1 Tax=Reichenbachiella ulvae TaxID=2980104 RepID=A0ABT3CTZ7_9BACT|nr:hypothetical protein [Reichenbachiella ulvae]MCV9387107.1 hypothetical protein [Reichenbachiella ulvae]